MEFNSTLELLRSDPRSKAYFDSLPTHIQQVLLDRCTGARNLDELKSFGDDLRTTL